MQLDPKIHANKDWSSLPPMLRSLRKQLKEGINRAKKNPNVKIIKTWDAQMMAIKNNMYFEI